MITLFIRYRDSGKISEALLVGRNIFNKNPGNADVFDCYFSYLCTLAESLPSLSDRQQFAEQAGVALAFYKENAELSEETVESILCCQLRLEDICNDIEKALESKLKAAQDEAYVKNVNCFKQLFALKDKLANASSKEELDAALIKIWEIDSCIDKKALTSEQGSVYDSLTKEYTDLISSKTREIEYKENVAYNKRAADAYAKAFKTFREDEAKYKNQTQLFTLVSATLFAFDATCLFNETLIYYNHVYSYIFSKLDDDGKLTLTRHSIECERILR